MTPADGSRHRGSDESISVAELLKRMGSGESGDAQAATTGGSTRRHHRSAEGGISVSELTGSLPVLDGEGRPGGRAARRRAREEEEARRAAAQSDGAQTADSADGSTTGTAGEGAAVKETRVAEPATGKPAAQPPAADKTADNRPTVDKPATSRGPSGETTPAASAGSAATRPPIARRTVSKSKFGPTSDKSPMPPKQVLAPSENAGAAASRPDATSVATAGAASTPQQNGARDLANTPREAAAQPEPSTVPDESILGLPSGSGSHTGPIDISSIAAENSRTQEAGTNSASTPVVGAAGAAGAAAAGVGAAAAGGVNKTQPDTREAAHSDAPEKADTATLAGGDREREPFADKHDKTAELTEDTAAVAPLDDSDGELDSYDEFDDDAWDQEPQRGGIAQWVVLAFQVLGAAVAGAALFVAFQLLWRDLKFVALALAIVVIIGLVAIVRVLRRGNDWTSIALAVIVGAGVTFGPLLLRLVT